MRVGARKKRRGGERARRRKFVEALVFLTLDLKLTLDLTLGVICTRLDATLPAH